MSAFVALLKAFKRHLLTNGKSDQAETWLEALGRYENSELLKSFRSDIQGAPHPTVVMLKFFKRLLLPNRKWDVAETTGYIEAT